MTAALTGGDRGPAGVPAGAVIDVVYALSSPEVFELLVRQCGWSTEQFQDWLAATLTTLALDPDPTTNTEQRRSELGNSGVRVDRS